MKVIQMGPEQKVWSRRLECTGAGFNSDGCRSSLLVEGGDLFITRTGGEWPRDTVAFICPVCGALTALGDQYYPRPLPSRDVWTDRISRIESDAITTVDAVITFGKTEVVLIRRAKEPFLDKLVLPGGHVERGESPQEACVREIEEETGLRVALEQLKFLTVLDREGRDPRPGKRVSGVYHVALPRDTQKQLRPGSDAREILVRGLVGLSQGQVGFDHWKAINMVRREYQ